MNLTVAGPLSAMVMLAVWVSASELSGLFIVPPLDTSMLWLPAGLALSVFLSTPRRSWGWPAAVLVIGQLVSGVVLGERSIQHSLGWGLANVTGAVSAAQLLHLSGRQRGRPQPDFESVTGAPLLLGASLLGALLGALTAGVAVRFTQDGGELLWPRIGTWWAGDALAMFLITPLMLAPGRARSTPVDRMLGALALLVVAAAGTLALELEAGPLFLALVPSLAVPAQIVLAMKTGPRGAALVAPSLMLVAGIPAVMGLTVLPGAPYTPHDRFLILQAFLTTSHLAALLFAAALAQRERITQRHALLVDVGDALGSSLVAERVLQTALDRLVPWLADEVVVWHAGGEATQRAGRTSWLFEEVDGHAHEVLAETRVDAPGGSACLLPLHGRDTRFGLMGFGWSNRAPQEDDVALATAVAARVSVALENARLYEQTTEAVAAREEFISIAAHELRTPLTSLQLRLQSIQREGGFDDRLRERLGRALDQTTRLSRLVDLLLDVSRVQAGALRLQRQPVRLAQLAQDVVERFAEQARQAGSALHLEVRGDPVGDYDRLRIEQVLTNLLSNALKFGKGRPVSVVVEAENGEARLVVHDEGLGVNEATRAKLFDRFWRGVSVEHFGGLGLGLYLSRHLVEAHGGHIVALEKTGPGATFVVTLPLAAPAVETPVG